MKNTFPYPLKSPKRLCRVAAATIFSSIASLAGAMTPSAQTAGAASVVLPPMPVDTALPSYQPRPAKPPAGARYVTRDGSIRVIGAEHTQTIIEGFDALFAKTHPGAKFDLQLKGTGGSVPALAHGVTLFAPMGREIDAVEIVPYNKIAGQEPVEIRVAHASNMSHDLATSLAIYVNKANPLERITMEQAARIFTLGQPKGDFTRWGQLGLKDDWATRMIHPYSTPEYTGFGTYMLEHHFGGRQFRGVNETYDNSDDILKRVEDDAAGIGIAAVGRLTPNLKMLAVADKDGGNYSSGSPEDVTAGKYPLGRYLYFYVRRAPGEAIDPFVKEYFRLILSKEGQQIIAAQPNGYMPLTAREAAEELAKLDQTPAKSAPSN